MHVPAGSAGPRNAPAARRGPWSPEGAGSEHRSVHLWQAPRRSGRAGGADARTHPQLREANRAFPGRAPGPGPRGRCALPTLTLDATTAGAAGGRSVPPGGGRDRTPRKAFSEQRSSHPWQAPRRLGPAGRVMPRTHPQVRGGTARAPGRAPGPDPRGRFALPTLTFDPTTRGGDDGTAPRSTGTPGRAGGRVARTDALPRTAPGGLPRDDPACPTTGR